MAIQLDKPYKGELYGVQFHDQSDLDWDGKIDGQQTLKKYASGTYCIAGKRIALMWATSLIVSIEDDVIETLNSRYRIVSYAKGKLDK